MSPEPDHRPQPAPTTEVELFSVAGADGYLRQVNHRFADLLGIDADRLEGRSLLELVHPDDLPEVVAGLAALAGGHREVMVENRFRDRDGGWVHLQWVARPLPDSDLWWAAGRDTTPFHRLRAEGDDLKARLQLAVGEAAATWELDLRTGALTWEPRAAELLGVDAGGPPADVESLLTLLAETDRAHARQAFDALAVTGAVEVDVRMVGDAARHLSLRGTVTERDRRERATRAVGLVLDVTSAKAMEEQLLRMVMTDPLTGAANRRAFDQTLRAAWRQAVVQDTCLSVLMIDVDDFKRLNDTHGHLVGDQVLTTVWRTLEATVRDEGGGVARFGGEEFTLALPGVDAEGAVAVAERLCAAVRAVRIRQAPCWRPSVSIGTATRTAAAGPASSDELTARADSALYLAKASGKDRVEAFETSLAGQLELESAIRAGLAADEFVLHYQPIVAMTTGRVVGCEALMRWQRPGHGLLGPHAFIPVAEKSDLIVDLGVRALELATRQACVWAEPGLAGAEPGLAGGGSAAGVRVSVNLSARHVGAPRVVDDVAAALESSGLAPELLGVELTETALGDSALVEQHLRTLRTRGVAVAIDDFGTGYTALGQLPHIPADTLKIDRSFVASPDPRRRELVTLMIAAARTFGLDVVAEGIETQAEYASLRDAGCDQAQGYLIARPMPAADLAAWWADRRSGGWGEGDRRDPGPDPVGG